MKKLSLAFIFAFFSGASLLAQTPDWEWARTAGSYNNDRCLGLASDTNGNIYSTGFGGYGSPIVFDTISLNSPSYFVSKHSPSGNIQWAKGTTGGSGSVGTSITTASGNIYVSGDDGFGTINFSGYTLNCNGIFLVKYKEDGTTVWAKNLAGLGGDSANVRNIVSDKIGNIYVTGFFNSHKIYFGNTILVNKGQPGSSKDVFVAKYDSSGNALWAVNAGGNGYDYSNAIAIDGFDNIYITGFSTSPSMDFDGIIIPYNGNSYHIFFAKYDSNGIIQWANGFGNSNTVIGNSITVDELNNIYLVGSYSGTSITFQNSTIVNPAQYGGFVSKFDGSGNVIWLKNISSKGDIGIQKLNITSNKNSFIISGTFTDSLLIGNDQLVGNQDIFVARYDLSGIPFWVKQAFGNNIDAVTGIINIKDNIYISGNYKSDSLFFDNITLVNTYPPPNFGNEDMFIANLFDSTLAKVYEIEKENIFYIFPNPANTSIAIKLNKNLQEVSSLKIMNMQGEIVAQHKLLKNNYDAQQIDISQLPNGIYVYSLFSNNKQLGKPGKLVILH